MELNINPNWTFAEVVKNLWTLRDEYDCLLMSFSYFDLHEKVVFMRKTRDAFYSLDFDVWKKDKIWNFMNHFEYYSTLKDMVRRGK
jgi:hypothetical protein